MVLGMNKEKNQCSELSEKTMHILDNDILVNLFVSTQKNNLDLCIEQGIKLVFIYTDIYIYTQNPQEYLDQWCLFIISDRVFQIK